MKTNLRLVSFDETKYWNPDFLKELGIKKVTTIYVYDANRAVHCCDIRPSYELYMATTMADNEHEMSDDDYEAWNNEWRSADESPDYHYCSGIDKISEKYIGGENFEYETDEEHYDKMLDAKSNFDRFYLHLV